MHSEETFSDLVGLIYDAAVDAKLWMPFLQRLEQALRTPWCVFHVHDLARGKCDVAAEIGFDPAYRRSYEQHYVSKNVFFIEGKGELWPGNVCSDDALCPEPVLFRSEFYNDWLAPQGMLHGINATVVKKESLVSLIGLIRKRGTHRLDEDDVSLVRSLMPHLQRAVQIHYRFSNLQAAEHAARDALDCWSLGVILLDPKGGVLMMNRAAEAVVQRRTGLTVGPDGLHAALVEETARLRALVRGALSGWRRDGLDSGGSMTFSRAGSERPLRLFIAPLSSHPALIPDHRAGCIVFVTDPDAEPESDEKLLQRLYGFTVAEAKVTALLIRGMDVKGVSEELDVSLNTTRTHLKRIFDKTNTKRQAELMSLILRGPISLEPR